MRINDEKHSLAGTTAAIVTTAAFSKTFLPFYLIGSTAIFLGTSVVGIALLAINWRAICDMASKMSDVLLLLAALYALVIVNFLLLSRPAVPTTHLLGILIFHALFLAFGFATARALNVLLLMLLGAAGVYLIVIFQYTARFGDLEQSGNLHDIFGVGDPAVYVTFHQNIGFVVGLGVVAAIGLAPNRTSRILAFGSAPLAILLMFYISARGALAALIFSLIFLISADFWIRSKKITLVGVMVVTLILAFGSDLFYNRAINDKDVDQVAPDAITRTIREIQDPRPGFRMQIWSRAWHRVSTEQNRLLFGRGVGMYPIDEGFGAPDWLLHSTEGSKHYPHNVYLEILYETGIVGLLVFSLLTILPIVASLRRWSLFSAAEKSAVTIFVFTLVSSAISGAFAYTYMEQFFLALIVGIVALKRTARVETPGRPTAASSNQIFLKPPRVPMASDDRADNT